MEEHSLGLLVSRADSLFSSDIIWITCQLPLPTAPHHHLNGTMMIQNAAAEKPELKDRNNCNCLLLLSIFTGGTIPPTER